MTLPFFQARSFESGTIGSEEKEVGSQETAGEGWGRPWDEAASWVEGCETVCKCCSREGKWGQAASAKGKGWEWAVVEEGHREPGLDPHDQVGERLQADPGQSPIYLGPLVKFSHKCFTRSSVVLSSLLLNKHLCCPLFELIFNWYKEYS